MDSPQKRLEYYISNFFKSKADFCTAIGMRKDAINKYLGAYSSVMGGKYVTALTKLGLNYSWYVDGQGEMLLSDELAKPMQITKEFPPEVRSALSKASAYTLEERLSPSKLYESKPDLDYFDLDAVKDLDLEKIKILKQKNIDLLDRLFENVIALREKYEKTQFNQNNHNTEAN